MARLRARIILALLFGVIIATPLVLTVFGSEVVSQAQNDQSNALLMYESQLKRCNPLPGQSAAASRRPVLWLRPVLRAGRQPRHRNGQGDRV